MTLTPLQSIPVESEREFVYWRRFVHDIVLVFSLFERYVCFVNCKQEVRAVSFFFKSFVIVLIV